MTDPTDIKKNLAAALAAFHTDLPKVGKGAVNPAFKSKYADLADIVAAVLPALARQGLAWLTTPTMTEDGFVLRYELRHEGGESITGSWPLPDPSKSTPQQLGSAVTYAKRYTLSAVTGIAPDEDDDGNAASAKSAPRAQRQPAAEKLDAAIEAVGTARTAEDLDKIEGYATRLGINGVARFKSALADRRVELGESTTDRWAATSPDPQNATSFPAEVTA